MPDFELTVFWGDEMRYVSTEAFTAADEDAAKAVRAAREKDLPPNHWAVLAPVEAFGSGGRDD
jgi:hypothetical protein